MMFFSKNGGAQILVSVSVSGLFFEKPMVKRGTLIFEIRSYPLHVHSTSFYRKETMRNIAGGQILKH